MSSAAAAGLCLLGLALSACGPDRLSAIGAGDEVARWPTWVVSSPGAVEVPSPGAVDEHGGAALQGGRRAGSPVLGGDWLELAMSFVSARAKDPPGASRAYALVSVAAFDAMVTARYWQRVDAKRSPSGSGGPGRSSPSEETAVAGAASRVLAFLFPEQSVLRLDERAEQTQSSDPSGEAAPADAAGLALGRAVADVIIERARSDGADRVWDGTRPPPGPGDWHPPPGSVSPPVQPLAGSWRTWLLSKGDALRPPPPPAYGSPEFLADARELVELKAGLTDEQRASARYWEGGEGTPLPPGIWNQIILEHLERDAPPPPEAVRTLALVNVAMADAGVAAWDAKYTYWTTRPENAIRQLLDPQWAPLLRTPLFPAYVSGHSTYSTAAATVLAHIFPRDAAEFHALAEEAGLSRLLGGIHYRSDHVHGARMGREIGRLAVARADLR